jgi:hypothetical protein
MSLFHKSLPDMVKGLRSAKNGDTLGKYVSDAMAAIKKELKAGDPRIKTVAVSKLTYLNMMGYDTTWAAFSIVEVMSLPRFAYKRVGYLAAAQCFTSNTDIVLLCTNLLQKELQGKNPYAIGLAVNCLANIANKDLARVLLGDLITMMTSSRVYIRKKAVLVMYKMFTCYPPGLRDAYPALKRKLSDEDPSVVSCAVNVICELACKKPKNYLPLAPLLFKLLQDSSNNWMLIKIVKLFANLMTEEPRLARKLMGEFWWWIMLFSCGVARVYLFAHLIASFFPKPFCLSLSLSLARSLARFPPRFPPALLQNRTTLPDYSEHRRKITHVRVCVNRSAGFAVHQKVRRHPGEKHRRYRVPVLSTTARICARRRPESQVPRPCWIFAADGV